MAIIKELKEEKTYSDDEYEVFLSFRGEDTRLGFTDHLHKALVEADINTFLDDESIESGEDLKPGLERAIKQSRAAVIVLSKNYASSTWCLNELLMILEQRRNFGMIVLPIFYHVDPSHFRKQEDSFAEAMKKHEKSIEEEIDLEKKAQRTYKLKLWKKALTEVADLKGKDIKGWHETKFIQKVVTEITYRLDRKASKTSEHLTGMLFQVREIESWLQYGSMEVVDFLSICGIGGIGKTYLAQYIYDRNVGLTENSCFLENISTSVKRDGMLSLQKQLLKGIKGKQDISRVNEGTIMIEKALVNKRVFIVLDDVDNVDQLNALLGTKGFHLGSKVIITTKDRSLPKKCEVWNTGVSLKKYTEHLLEGLDTYESLELLSWHSFKCNGPKEGYEELSRQAVEYCKGHPLALKVLGSSLFQRDKAAWEDTLELLEKESTLDIHSVLKISFDSLSDNDKMLFKYIACFFVGADTEYIGKILKECNIRTSSGIPNLIDKCLLTVESCNSVKMHQLLQEMGRHIVHQESLVKPWKRSILCCHEESFDVLKQNKGTKNIHGLLLDMKMIERKKSGGYNSTKKENCEDDIRINSITPAVLGRFQTFISRYWWLFGWLILLICSVFNTEKGNLKTESFTKMSNLALLQLNFVKLTGSYKKFPISLKWLCWHGFSSQYIPQDLPMANLVALDMSHSNLEQLWKMPKTLTSLKILNLSSSVKLIRTGDLSGLANLEWLILARCGSLVEICESIGYLKRLTTVDLSYCVKLRKLPKNMNKLRMIGFLLLEGCPDLFKTLPYGTGTMAMVPQFSMLAHSIVHLSLAKNGLHNESFPKDFSSLSSLLALDLSENLINSLPDCVRTLVRIEELSLSDCENLKSVINLPSTIKVLIVWGCKSIEIVTLDSAHSKVPLIATLYGRKLREVQGISKVKPIIKTITDRSGWYNLRYLEHRKLIYGYPVSSTKLHEFGITCSSWNRQLPDWFTYKTKGSTISLTVPPSPNNLRIRGLNVCFLQTFRYSISGSPSSVATKISNVTKNITWKYINRRKSRNGIVINHWIFRNNELEVGDEIRVSVGKLNKGLMQATECKIGLVYDENNNDILQGESKEEWIQANGDLSDLRSATIDEAYHLHHPQIKFNVY